MAMGTAQHRTAETSMHSAASEALQQACTQRPPLQTTIAAEVRHLEATAAFVAKMYKVWCVCLGGGGVQPPANS
jgi:hypothetical protein